MDRADPESKAEQTPGTPSPEHGMRIYAAILGRTPTVDPTIDDPFEAHPAQRRIHDVARRFHLVGADEPSRPPTWRQLLESAADATEAAGRRLDEARRRFRRPAA